MINKTLIGLFSVVVSQAHAFVLMGPTDAGGQEDQFLWPNNAAIGGTQVGSANLIDDLGTPKYLSEFYRWNTPHLTYGFDQSFVEYFGEDGVSAINDAMGVLNDFFKPIDGSYLGVSSMDLNRSGFGRNYNTAWLNPTANNENLIDIKSLTLGLMVNYLGLGNPYRYAFTATNAIVPNATASGAIFSVALKNYDPISLDLSDKINGVQYSYRLIHDQPPGSIADQVTVNNMVLDLEEFTTDTSGNAFTAVSAISDAFYGATQLVWTDPPSIFGFGVFFDGMNAMGGMYQPRHALTYDDAGGLQYLYSTNTISMEYNPYTLIVPADFTAVVDQYGLPPSGSETINRSVGVFPVRTTPFSPLAGLPTNPTGGLATPTVHPLSLFANPVNMGAFGQGTSFIGSGVGKMDWAYRGGVDSITFHSMPYDSLLNMTHFTTNFVWNDTFMTNAMIRRQVAVSTTNSNHGAEIQLVSDGAHYFTQTLGRSVFAPDFLFSATNLAATPNGISTAFTRTTWVDLPAPAPAAVTAADPPVRWNASNQNLHQIRSTGVGGPGVMASLPLGPSPPASTNAPSGFNVAFNSAFAVGGYNLFWNGEVSVIGNLEANPVESQMWAYIKGPGPNDLIRFPSNESVLLLYQNSILPVAGKPEISMISDNGGISAISPNSLSRTNEDLTILGKNFRNSTAIELVNNNGEIVQLIYPITQYIGTDRRIVIPSGVIKYDAEGNERRVRVWNPVGRSDLSEDSFSITTGPTVLFATSHDGIPYNREDPLTLVGIGFKSKQIDSNEGGNATITHIRIEDTDGNPLLPTDGNGSGIEISSKLDVLSDEKAILRGLSLPGTVEGKGRMVRVSRGTPLTMSDRLNSAFNYISSSPSINDVKLINLSTGVETDVNSTSPLERDSSVIILGSGLSTVTRVEIVRQNGSSFEPVIDAILSPLNVEENGTLVRLDRYAISSSGADGHGQTSQVRLKVHTSFGSAVYESAFNVNIQPNDGSSAQNEEVLLAGLKPADANTGITGLLWNRDVLTGDDLTFIGSGLKAVKRIVIEHSNGTALSPEPSITLSPLGTPGVVLSDTLIKIDTSLAQFSNITVAEAVASDHFMRFRLESDRKPVTTSPEVNQRFLVSVPPVIDFVNLSGGGRNFRRDNDNATIEGSGLNVVNEIEIVDKNGLVVAAGSGVRPPNTSISLNENDVIELNGAIFDGLGGGLDTTISLNRRIKVSTPWGSAFSDDNASGAFTVSATPSFPSTPGLTFAGINSGFNGLDTYDLNATTGTAPDNLLPLVINGQNFLGVKTIRFEDNGSNTYYSVNVNPASPPAGFTFKADGTQIIISGKVIYDNNASWAQDGNNSGLGERRIKLTSVADQNATTLSIKTDPAWNDNNN